MSIKKFTPERIKMLSKNEVFVFGSNIQGEHVGGAAWQAFQKFGAELGKGFGYQGQSYAIPTCIRLQGFGIGRYTKPFDNVNQIKPYIEVFINEVSRFKDFTFYVTKLGCGIAGFKVSEVAELFRPCLEMENVILPKEFVEWLLYPKVIAELNKRGLVGGKDYDDDIVMNFVMERISGNKSLDDILDEFENIKPY
jgi:hypothetical protein